MLKSIINSDILSRTLIDIFKTLEHALNRIWGWTKFRFKLIFFNHFKTNTDNIHIINNI